MGRELRRIEIAFTVHDPDHLPTRDGEQLYADDVAEEIRAVVGNALAAWHAGRGLRLLAHEPLVL
jgi:hypothetical protein